MFDVKNDINFTSVDDMMKDRIYLDHASTTPVASEVLEKLLPHFNDQFGNPSSRSHSYGWEAEQAIEEAAEALASLLKVFPSELTFTSGSTESINLAINGIAKNYPPAKCHLITTSSEHSAVLDVHASLEEEGYEVTYLKPDSKGLISPKNVQNAVRQETKLVSILWANNETGVLQDVKSIGKLCEEQNLLLFADATQIIGKMTCHPRDVGVHALALSAHKFYGPKGVGALWHSDKSPRVDIRSPLQGASHQKVLRKGTLNTPGIVGLGAAAKLAQREMHYQGTRLFALREFFESELCRRLPELIINGKASPRLPHISNISFRFTEAEALMSAFNRRLAVSTGSACASADLEPSHVLLSMGLSREDAKSALRISMGRNTKKEDINIAIELIESGVKKLRGESPTWELFQDGLLH